MSTRAIREALDRLRRLERHGDGEFDRVDAADAEVEVIEKACVFFLGAEVPNVLPRDEAARHWTVLQRIGEDAP